MKSKIVLGASLAIATLGLVSLFEIEGFSPFLIENVSANTHSVNKVINHKVNIYLENADEGKGLTVNFSTDSVSPNLFDEFKKKSGITITTMLVNAKTGEVVEKILTPRVFLRSNDLTSGTTSSFIFSEYPDGEYKYVVSEGDFIDPKTQFKHQYRGESPVFRIRNRKYVELGTTDKKLDERRDNSVYKDGVVEHKVNLSLTSYEGGNGVTAIFSTDNVNSNLLNSFGEKAKEVFIRSKLINVKTGEVIDETFSPKVSLTSKILKSGSTAVFYFIDLTDGEYKYVAYESQQYTDPQTTLTHQYRGESPIFSIKDGKFSGLVSASKPDENPKPTPKPDEKPKPTPKPTVQSGWVGSSYYQDGKKVTSKWIFDKKYNSFFYLDASGNYVQNAWVGNYYLKSGGYMAKSEWIYDKNYGSYYYLTSEGSYARNTWSGNYYLKSNGKMAKGEWIYDKNYGSYYYLTSEGSYARNAWSGNYYLKSNGKMAKSEWVYDKNYGSYYYLTSEGSYARNTWVGNYYLKSNGKMAKSEWVDGGRYYVGANGLWETKASTNSEYSAALGKAKSYNSLFHMSKKRMYRQLTSEFDKFSNDAAQYAIDHLEADYKYNALFNAKNYRKLFNMSKAGLFNQLTSYIDGFTEEEANYAINHLDD